MDLFQKESETECNKNTKLLSEIALLLFPVMAEKNYKT